MTDSRLPNGASPSSLPAMSDSDPTTLQVRYENTTASYANQIVVNANREDLILNFSSGAIHDPQSGEAILPIHSRIALSWNGAARLRALIDQALQSQQQAAAGEATSPDEPATKE